MVIAIRIVLSLIALGLLYVYVALWCYYGLFVPDRWDSSCAAKTIGIFVGIPLAMALVAGYLKKSKPVFWNVFVATFFVMAVVSWFILWIL